MIKKHNKVTHIDTGNFIPGRKSFRSVSARGVSELQLELTKRIIHTRNKIEQFNSIKIGICSGEWEINFLKRTNCLHEIKELYCMSYDNRWWEIEKNHLDFNKINELDLLILLFKEEKQVIFDFFKGKLNIPVLFIYEKDLFGELYELLHTESVKATYLSMLDKIDYINSVFEHYKNDKIAVYGVGEHTKKLLEYTCLSKCNISRFIDKRGGSINGLKVWKLDEIANFEEDEYVLLSSYLHQEEMRDYVISKGCNNIICLYDENDTNDFYKMSNIYKPEDKREFDDNLRLKKIDLDILLEERIDYFVRKSDYYLTYSMSDKFFDGEEPLYERPSDYLEQYYDYINIHKKIALVIQGPICYQNDFTYNSILLYKELYKGAKIILSTWSNEENKIEFKKIKELGIDIIFSDLPKEKSILTINYQIISTYEGIKYAYNINEIEYCLKIRSDFRIQDKDALVYMYYCINQNKVGDTDRNKIIVFPPFIDVRYYIQDFISFGEIKDMLMLWRADELINNISRYDNAETSLFKRYLNDLGYGNLENVEFDDYIEILLKEFWIIERNTFDIVWNKYSYKSLQERYRPFQGFSMIKWWLLNQKNGENYF